MPRRNASRIWAQEPGVSTAPTTGRGADASGHGRRRPQLFVVPVAATAYRSSLR